MSWQCGANHFLLSHTGFEIITTSSNPPPNSSLPSRYHALTEKAAVLSRPAL
jgi:hypothetical protein